MRGVFALILLFSYFILVFSSDLCPPPELVKPCECISGYNPVTYKCSHVFDQDTVEGVFKKSLDWPLNACIFDYSSLLYVSTPLINSKNITIVAIYHSRFVSLFPSPPDVTNKIENIILRNTTFTRGLDFTLLKNVKAKIILIEEVVVKRISNHFVENVNPSLTRLRMDKAKIKIVHPEAFAKLTSLVSLSVAYNSIKEIKRSMFPPKPLLRLIDFSKNQIAILPDDIFSNMLELTDVYLRENKIKTFSLACWGGIFDHMQVINVVGNPIICDCKVKWYTEKSRSVKVSGTCDVPEHMKGWNLIQLTPGDFHYCPK